MRRRNLPQSVDVSVRGLEVVGLQRVFGFRDQVDNFLRILRSSNNRRRRGTRRFTLGTEQLECKEHDGEHDGGTAANHDCQAPRIEFFCRRLEVGPSRPRHCGRFGERVCPGGTGPVG
jgi:hypothetical protein